MEKAYIHIYTGDGKGKSTAAFGLALRAMMSGRRVYVGQFVKSMKYNETRIEKHFPDLIHIEQLGSGCFIEKDPEEKDIALAQSGLRRCAELIQDERTNNDYILNKPSAKLLHDSAQENNFQTNQHYDIIILDEISIALHYHLITVDQVIAILKNRRPSQEIILTGRYMPQELIDLADLVTEMKEIKHYYTQGVLSREGIDK